jgi:hypothetical protein
MIYYKIRKKSDPEMYLKGTPYYQSYDKTGRIFQKLGALRSFLTNVMNGHGNRSNIGDWEVVEMEMVVKEVKDIHKIVKPEKLMKLLKDI